MKFSVRVYHEDGSSRGEAIIDSFFDTLNGLPITSLGMAKTYANYFLVGKNCYAFIERA